jgi:glucose-1-phosphate thymidylyltransferase
MRCIILAAGYGTGLYPLTKDTAGSLLPIRGRPIIEHIVNKVKPVKGVSEILIVTNARFFQQFREWADNFSCPIPIKLIDDGSCSYNARSGALKDLSLVLEGEGFKRDVLVVGGDNIFSSSLGGFMDYALSVRPDPLVGVYNLGKDRKARKFGIVYFDETGRVVDFHEKPSSLNGSRFVSLCLYFFPKETLCLLPEYVKTNGVSGFMGNYIKWLSLQRSLRAYEFKGEWLDVGDRDSYTRAVCSF